MGMSGQVNFNQRDAEPASVISNSDKPCTSRDEDDMFGDIIYKYSITAQLRAQEAVETKQASESSTVSLRQRQHNQKQARQQPLEKVSQSDKHADERKKMIVTIVRLIGATKAPRTWLRRVPRMAIILEEWLYRTAPSFEAYRDLSTLKQRLRRASMDVSTKIKISRRTKLEAMDISRKNEQLQQQALLQHHRQTMLQHYERVLAQHQHRAKHIQQQQQITHHYEPGQVLTQQQQAQQQAWQKQQQQQQQFPEKLAQQPSKTRPRSPLKF